MEIESPFRMIKGLEMQLIGTLSTLDIYTIPAVERKIVSELRRDIVDARLDIRDYELSETRAEQLEKAKAARARLVQIRKLILSASEFNIFNAVDVAQLTAIIEQIEHHIV